MNEAESRSDFSRFCAVFGKVFLGKTALAAPIFSERAAICAPFLDKADLLWYNTGVGLCTAAPYRMNDKGGCHV